MLSEKLRLSLKVHAILDIVMPMTKSINMNNIQCVLNIYSLLSIDNSGGLALGIGGVWRIMLPLPPSSEVFLQNFSYTVGSLEIRWLKSFLFECAFSGGSLMVHWAHMQQLLCLIGAGAARFWKSFDGTQVQLDAGQLDENYAGPKWWSSETNCIALAFNMSDFAHV